MKSKNLFFLSLSALLLTAACAPKQPIPEIVKNHKDKALFSKVNDGTAEMISLFNGRDFEGFYTYTAEYGVNNDAEQAFNVENGMIRLAGKAMGYFCTTGVYKNYYLRVVTRWGDKKFTDNPEEVRNSGVLYHFPTGAEDQLWPLAFECQLMEGSAGDYWLIGGADADSPNRSPEGNRNNIKHTENFENPYPEWNTVEVICYDDKSEHYVNGHLVNEAYNLNLTEGRILLQLEGAEIYFKTIELLPLK